MSEATWAFCLDIGGSKTTGALFAPDGREVARAATGPGALSLGAPVAEAAIRDIWRQVGDGRPADRVLLCAGIAGSGFRDRVAALSAALLDFAGTRFVDDGYGLALAATAGRPGALIAVGTGVAALQLLPGGTFRSLSGWGFPGGDLGGGAWIGLQAVGALTRNLDGLAVASPMGQALADALQDHLGGTASAIMERITGGKASDYARLAPIVLAAAEAGDQAAQDIVRRAGAEIGALGEALTGGSGVLYLTGGLAAELAPAARAAAPGLDWRPVRVDPLRGLLLLVENKIAAGPMLPRRG
ncbi:probable N-acetylglucosamine kinase [Oceanicola granulosus HTCC2516]|uniref:Probable N-acetylglucosamine kinase n=1 Tax=Oceanicola granulosus (strain ATCC BAA-861 / DSM 15982 / KCTC 12143 / HTCC2516) TaxID=314256 RepID=Q2CEE1_OCEGH|nr:BadF/BadG/BcrA/BcrD ATPase family protein [Oceanicola granulosus]EAR51056.1 probable N-acetylglucosamine kinase [Oceanicola granulosus HTCC2516]